VPRVVAGGAAAAARGAARGARGGAAGPRGGRSMGSVGGSGGPGPPSPTPEGEGLVCVPVGLGGVPLGGGVGVLPCWWLAASLALVSL
jgi:hypothetical protein